MQYEREAAAWESARASGPSSDEHDVTNVQLVGCAREIGGVDCAARTCLYTSILKARLKTGRQNLGQKGETRIQMMMLTQLPSPWPELRVSSAASNEQLKSAARAGSAWLSQVLGHHLPEGACAFDAGIRGIGCWEDVAEEIIELGGMSDRTCIRPEAWLVTGLAEAQTLVEGSMPRSSCDAWQRIEPARASQKRTLAKEFKLRDA